MALFQSETAKRRETPPTGYVSGSVQCAIFTFTFNANFTAATDILEIGLLPANTIPVRARLIPVGLTASNTADVGFMSGEPGDPDPTRTSGDELFDGVAAVAAEAAAPDLGLLAVTRSELHRAIGIKMTEDIAAGANKKITLILEYVH